MLCVSCRSFPFLIPRIITWEVVHGGSNVWSFLHVRKGGALEARLVSRLCSPCNTLERLGLTHSGPLRVSRMG